MNSVITYIPIDRRQALAQGQPLPDRANGAVLFADISGFTPLTEALLRELGARRGADILTHHLNLVYDALIVQVHRHGGSVIGFSGDAITCWFDDHLPGLPHPPPARQRAVGAALAMQQAMRQVVAIQTPSGLSFSLALKVAVTTGPVRRFRVGDPQVQYIDVLAGATLDRMAGLEEQAQRGEVLVSAEVVTQGMVVAEWRQAGQVARVVSLAEPVTATPWPENGSPPENIERVEQQVRPWLLPPVYRRLHQGQEGFLAEIRPAVSLFLRFGGLDYDHDEAAGSKLDTYIRWVQHVLARYEGFLLQLTHGDKGSYLYAAFGAPVAHGDDTSRAVAAALELSSPPSSLAFIGPVQIGLSQGRMWAGAYGGIARRTYGVLGDEVNTAARLMKSAEPGQVLVSFRVAKAAGSQFRLEPLGHLKLKGKEKSLLTFRVLGRQPLSLWNRMIPLFERPLVGREAELALFKPLLRKVTAGEGQILSLAGPAGVGKSHLVAKLAKQAEAQGFQVGVGLGQSTDQANNYQPWQSIFQTLFELVSEPVLQLRELLGEINPDWVDLTPLLGDLLDLPFIDSSATEKLEPEQRRNILFTLAINLIQARAARQPLLLWLEDCHWLDEASQELTLALTQAISSLPILLVLVYRPPAEASPWLSGLHRLAYHHPLTLGELPSPAIANLVAQQLEGPVSELALAFIGARTGGNPLFIEEVVRVLQEQGRLERQDHGLWELAPALLEALHAANCLARDPASGGWNLNPHVPLPATGLGLPDTVHGTILARLDRLPEAYKVTLKSASVIGTSFEFEALAEAHPLQPDRAVLLDQLQTILTGGFAELEASAFHLTYRFNHSLTREAIYETLLEAQRQMLHWTAGEALAKLQPEAVERLAHHYSRSDTGRAEIRAKALFYLDKAARRVQQEYANETALSYYRQLLSLEERREWYQAEVDILHILGRREEEAETLQRLAGYADSGVYYRWGRYYEVIGDYTQAQESIKEALKLAQNQQDFLAEVHSLSYLGLIARRQGEYEQAKGWYHQALAHYSQDKAVTPQETQVFIHILNGLGTVYRQQQEFDQAQRCYNQALHLSRQAGNRFGEAEALSHLGVTANYQGQFAEALEYHRQALYIRRLTGDQAGEGASLGNLAQVITNMGDYSQAQRELAGALQIHQRIGNRWEEQNDQNDLGILYLLVGELNRAQDHFLQGLTISREIGDEAGQAYILCNLGQVALEQNHLAEAEQLLRESLELAQPQDDKALVAMCFSYLGLCHLQATHFDLAIRQAETALRMRRELGLPLLATLDLTTLARACLAQHQNDEAGHYASQALETLEACGGEGPEFPQRDYFYCAQVLAALGQAETAQIALQTAYDLLMALAQKITDPSLRLTFLDNITSHRDIITEHQRHLP